MITIHVERETPRRTDTPTCSAYAYVCHYDGTCSAALFSAAAARCTYNYFVLLVLLVVVIMNMNMIIMLITIMVIHIITHISITTIISISGSQKLTSITTLGKITCFASDAGGHNQGHSPHVF